MKKGFTLVELSIVLVIIGLLIGGILVGQSLIDAAKLNSLVREITSYQIATRSFKVKYDALPGDNDFFPHDGDDDVNNGVVYYPGSGAQGEWLRVWQHMSLAGVVEDSYTGLKSGGSVVRELNSPATEYDDVSVYGIVYAFNSGYTSVAAGNVLVLGNPRAGSFNADGAMTALESLGVDAKMDDGLPSSGEVTAPVSTTVPDCQANLVGGSSPYTSAEYNINNSTALCRLYIALQPEG